ncbi:hypothetical protein OVN18_10655 [Microcella daejeonensis]|uniref:Four-carbon acid sugar kinase family protein n=1 Tax=Microcella daejeonensis TaxID=2994971 RepID=A0A9E8MK23_9MICO|nr:four-carbon acid sugar kinase family protein [Microcella daejeonensis]WAB81010.1 hypothetical protein OVN18_10655 [Microcella daejeonensis]
MTVLVAADDLTGANDTAVQFARRGWNTRIQLDGGSSRSAPSGAPLVIAILTDSRALAPVDAARSVHDAVDAAHEAGLLYLKVDSTLRGSIAGQIAGALEGWSARHPGAFAVVCPAYPAMGRTVVAGQLLVGGVPVSMTAAGTDPVTPVASSDILDLVRGSRRALVDEIDGAAAGDVLILDAADDGDLRAIAARIAAIGPRAVPVGSAGLAIAVAESWAALDEHGPQNPFPAAGRRPLSATGLHLVQVTSLHDVARSQATALAERPGTIVVDLTLEDITDGSATGRLRCAVVSADASSILLVRPPEMRDPRAGTAAAQEIAEAMGDAVATIVREGGVARLGLVGGDGARAALRSLGVGSLTVTGAAAEGVPLSMADDGDAPGIIIWTKAGGFGEHRVLLDITATPTITTIGGTADAAPAAYSISREDH